MKKVTAMVLCLVLIAACSHRPKAPPPPLPPAPPATSEPPPEALPPNKGPATPDPLPVGPALVELFPHIRADMSARLIEFDGTVPIDCHNPSTPVVYLEVTVCTPDSKEHESLVVTPARPSHIHAALLAAGYQPGKPGSWTWANQALTAHPPTGDPLVVTIAHRDAAGREIELPATTWIRNAADNGPKFGAAPGSRFVFAGSAMVTRQGREMYNSDGSGLLIGLTTFGSETIAWSEVISHDASVSEPEWIADPRVVPRIGTPVVVRIRPATSAPAH